MIYAIGAVYMFGLYSMLAEDARKKSKQGAKKGE